MLFVSIIFVHMIVHECIFSPQGGKSVKDEETLESLEITNGGKLYFKDLGT